MDGALLIGITAALILLFVLGKMLMVPLRHVIKLVINGIIGGIMLLILNFFGAGFSLYVPVNIVTALVAGFLGIPGVVLLVGLRIIFA